MKIKKSKTVTVGDLISLKKDKVIKLRKDSKKGPDGIYFPASSETRLEMDGKVKSVHIPEHIKLKGIIVLNVKDVE